MKTTDAVCLWSLSLCPFLWKHQFFSVFLYCVRIPKPDSLDGGWVESAISPAGLMSGCCWTCWEVQLCYQQGWSGKNICISDAGFSSQSHYYTGAELWLLASGCLEPNPSFALVVIQPLRCQFSWGKQWRRWAGLFKWDDYVEFSTLPALYVTLFL